MLSLAGRPEPSAERIEACVGAVVAGIRQERLQQQLKPSRRPWMAAAAVIVLAVIASTMWWINNGQPAAENEMVAEATAVEVVEPAPAGESPTLTEPPPRAEIDMTQEEVRVYQYAVGDNGSTGAVFIVNPAMEL